MARKSHHRRRTAKPRIRRRTPAGAAPGTLHAASDSHPSTIHVLAYSADDFVERNIAQVHELDSLLDRFETCWIDVAGLGSVRLIQDLGERFHLHPLTLEDVINVHQRAKVDPYEKYLFVVARMVENVPTLRSEQMSMFVGDRYVLTFQEQPGDCLDPIRERVRKNSGRIRSAGPDYLMYALLDAIIDSYFPVLDSAADRLEELDLNVSETGMGEAMTGIHDVRNELLQLRRYIRPHRDAVNELVRDPHPLVGAETRVFLRDCYDHTMQLIDLLEIYQEMCSDLRDFYLSLNSNRLNEIMKVLTIISTIFMPLSFIAGIYGMNFDTRQPWNMPELLWPFGYLFALAIMLMTAASLVYFFWTKGWIGSNKPPTA